MQTLIPKQERKMTEISLVKEAVNMGLGIGAFGLLTWLVVFIVKRLATAIDKVVLRLEVFTTKVHEEHKESSKQHQGMMEQHGEMIKSLGRINGYKD